MYTYVYKEGVGGKTLANGVENNLIYFHSPCSSSSFPLIFILRSNETVCSGKTAYFPLVGAFTKHKKKK